MSPGVFVFVRVSASMACHTVSHDCLGDTRFLWSQVDWEDFDALRKRVNDEWHALPPTADVISPPLRDKMRVVAAKHGAVSEDAH